MLRLNNVPSTRGPCVVHRHHQWTRAVFTRQLLWTQTYKRQPPSWALRYTWGAFHSPAEARLPEGSRSQGKRSVPHGWRRPLLRAFSYVSFVRLRKFPSISSLNFHHVACVDMITCFYSTRNCLSHVAQVLQERATNGAVNNRHLFLSVLEAASPRSRCQQILSGEDSSSFTRGRLLAVSLPTRAREAPPAEPDCLPKASPPPISLGDGASMCQCGGTPTFVQSVECPLPA